MGREVDVQLLARMRPVGFFFAGDEEDSFFILQEKGCEGVEGWLENVYDGCSDGAVEGFDLIHCCWFAGA